MKNKFAWIPGIFLCIFFLGSCAEHKYYRTHHEHSERYRSRHPQKHVDVDIKVRP